jgi:hypothetical protein
MNEIKTISFIVRDVSMTGNAHQPLASVPSFHHLMCTKKTDRKKSRIQSAGRKILLRQVSHVPGRNHQPQLSVDYYPWDYSVKTTRLSIGSAITYAHHSHDTLRSATCSERLLAKFPVYIRVSFGKPLYLYPNTDKANCEPTTDLVLNRAELEPLLRAAPE